MWFKHNVAIFRVVVWTLLGNFVGVTPTKMTEIRCALLWYPAYPHPPPPSSPIPYDLKQSESDLMNELSPIRKSLKFMFLNEASQCCWILPQSDMLLSLFLVFTVLVQGLSGSGSHNERFRHHLGTLPLLLHPFSFGQKADLLKNQYFNQVVSIWH